LFGFTIEPIHQHQAKPNNKVPYIDKFIEPEPVFSPFPFSFSTVRLL